MSGADNVDFNTLERALSSDVDNLQSMQARFMADMLARVFSSKGVPEGNLSVPTDSITDRIIGGLIASVSGTVGSVDITPGALVQNSAALSPIPGALDSNFRMAINRVITTLAAPVPGGNTYYLLEAQMVNVVTSTVNRDIFNTGTGLFVSTPVTKLQERQVQFQWTAGSATQAPAPSANWVPIAIVFRAGGGGAVTADDIIDVRPLWTEAVNESASLRAQPISSSIVTSSVPGTVSNLATFDLEAMVEGRRLFARSTSAIDLSAASVIESGLVFANARLYYLYLAPWREQYRPANALLNVQQRGVLVMSAVPPDSEGFNSALITPPSPFAGADIQIGDAFCAASLYRTGGGWAVQSTDRGGQTVGMGNVGLAGDFYDDSMSSGPAGTFVNIDLDADGAGATPIVPPHARWVEIVANNLTLGAETAVSAKNVANTYTYANQFVTGVAGPRSTDGVFRLPLGTDRAFRFEITDTSSNLDTLALSVRGWGV